MSTVVTTRLNAQTRLPLHVPSVTVPLLLAGLGALGFFLTAVLLRRGVIVPVDTAWLACFALERTPARDLFAAVISDSLMVPNVFVLVFPVTGYLYLTRRRLAAASTLAIPLIGAVGIHILKFFFRRERPPGAHFYEPTGGFPSGHALAAVIVYGLLGYLLCRSVLRQRWQRVVLIALTAALILCSGLVRLYQQVHYPSDIYAGYAVGMMILCAGIAALETLERRADQVSHQVG